MSRNGSGTYTLPQAPFVPNTTISSAAMNSDLSDIANALTMSISSDGQTPTTGVFKWITGAAATPSLTFTGNTSAGMYSPATDQLGLVANGVGEIINGTAYAATGNPVVAGGGTGYVIGDQITLPTGTGVLNPIVVQVATVSGTSILTVILVEPGRYVTQPTNPVPQGATTGAGSGASFTITWTTVLALTDLNGNQLWQALGGSEFFVDNIVNATSLTGFLGAQSVQTYNLGNTTQGFNAPANLQISATVLTDILTIAVVAANGATPTSNNPVLITFRDATIADGDPVTLRVTSALTTSTIGSFGVTNGVTNFTPFRLWVVCFNNAGTPVLGLWQSVTWTSSTPNAVPSGIAPLDESTPQSSTSSSAGSSAATFYTNGVALSATSFKILGYVEYSAGLATPGTYNIPPTKVQLFGPGQRKPGDQVQLYSTFTSTLVTTTVINSILNIGVASSTATIISSIGPSTAVMSQAISPTFQGNLLTVEAQAIVTTNNAVVVGLYLMQDPAASGTSPLGVALVGGTSEYGATIRANNLIVAGSTTTTTLKAFLAPSAVSTVAMNGYATSTASNSTVIFNGTQSDSFITVRETMV